jgi:DNA repair protein RecO (recombination protein O)
MSAVSTEGIVLQLHPLTDTSLIVTWLTKERGRLKTVAKAARRPSSPFAGQLDLFHTCILSYAESRRSELHTLREVKLIAQPDRLRRDYSALKTAGKLVEFLLKSLEPEFPDPELYEMVQAYLRALETDANGRRESLRLAIWKHLK